MRILNFIVALSCVLLLANCSATKAEENIAAARNYYNTLPDGYYGSSKAPVLKPSGLEKGIEPIAWESADVSVYPVDSDLKPVDTQPIADLGELKQQLFFDHGSARLGKPDRNSLHQLAADLSRDMHDYKVNVVGHASTRVDHVTDPVRKKMINFEMAQKRADAVTRELHKAGIKPSSVTSVSKGDDVPNPNPGSMSQEAADRRVEVYVNK